MKICLVSLNALPALSEHHNDQRIGGAEVQLAQLAIALASRGHDVRMIVSDHGQPEGAVYGGVRTLRAFKPDAGVRGLRFFHPRLTGLWNAFARADADVYLYSCSGMLLGLLALYCRLNRRRLVYRVASDADCDLKTALIRSTRDRWLYSYGVAKADAVLVQSATQQGAMKQNFGRDSTVVRGLVEGPRPGWRATQQDIDVLWLANLRRLKRPDRFLDLAEALPQYRFHMAGGPAPGEEEYFRLIRTRAASLSNVEFHGKVPYQEVGDLFNRTRLFVNTSEIEGFPNTFLQAWIRGIPVATLFDPDSVVALNGLGSSHVAPADLIGGVRRLLDSPEVYSRANEAAVKFMREHSDEEGVLATYMKALSGRADIETAIPDSGVTRTHERRSTVRSIR